MFAGLVSVLLPNRHNSWIGIYPTSASTVQYQAFNDAGEVGLYSDSSVLWHRPVHHRNKAMDTTAAVTVVDQMIPYRNATPYGTNYMIYQYQYCHSM